MRPPRTVEVMRPHRSAYSVAGMVVRKMRRAEMPEARKEAVEDVRPAFWKRRGAYCMSFVNIHIHLFRGRKEGKGEREGNKCIHKAHHQSHSSAASPS